MNKENKLKLKKIKQSKQNKYDRIVNIELEREIEDKRLLINNLGIRYD